MGSTTTFVFDDRAIENIENLKGIFHSPSKAAVIRKALALLFVAKGLMDKEHTITIGDGANKKTVILD